MRAAWRCALLVAACAAAAPLWAQGSRTVLEAMDAGLASDPGFTATQRAAQLSALRERFADYGLQTASGRRADGVAVALRMIVEGSFDEVAPDRAAGVAFAAYQAVAR